jgi:hypothetical protein
MWIAKVHPVIPLPAPKIRDDVFWILRHSTHCDAWKSSPYEEGMTRKLLMQS